MRKIERKNNIKQPEFWNDECYIAVKNKKRAFRKMNGTHKFSDLLMYSYYRNQTKYIINRVKKLFFENYCKSLNRRSSIADMWRTIKQSNKAETIPNFGTTKNRSNEKEGADLLANHYEKYNNFCISSTTERNSKILVMESLECLNKVSKIVLYSPEQQSINSPFSMDELVSALKTMHAKFTAGPDIVSHLEIKSLPMPSLEYQLSLFNKSWSSGSLPQIWTHAFIKPILKAGTDKQDVNS